MKSSSNLGRYSPVRLIRAGAIAIALVLITYALGFATSPEFDSIRAVVLIASCDLIVAALILSTCRVAPVADASANLQSLLSGAIADGVIVFAMTAAGLIALFGDSESIERLGYFLAIFVLVPLCVTLAWRRQRMGSTEQHQRFVALATLASTVAALLLGRVLTPFTAGSTGTSLFVLLELVAARAVIELTARIPPAAWLRRLPAWTTLAAVPMLLAIGTGAFIPTATISFPDLAIPLAAALTASCLVNTLRGCHLPRVWTHVVDAAILIVASLVVFYAGPPSPELAENQNFFLGPALDVLHGHPMLVDTFSQYGVGMIYALAGVFIVVPIGYGTFTLLLSGVTVLFFAVIYAVLRWSTTSILVAAGGLATIVVLKVFGGIGLYVAFPSTGVLRFGLPWAIVFCSIAAARAPRQERLFDGLTLAIVAVATIWSGETAAYCLGTAGALACFRAAVTDASAGERIGSAARHIMVLLAVSAASLLLFTLTIWITAGDFPDWAGYLEYIYGYTAAGFGELPIDPWSLGLAIGCIYTVSAVVIVLVAMTRPALVRERAAAFRAVTGLTALGTLTYSYFLGRSHPNNLFHISPPVVALLFVWFDIARSTLNSRVAVAVATGTIVFLVTMVLTSERINISQKYPSSALAAVLGATAPLDTQLRTLSRNPLFQPATEHIVRFVQSLGIRRTRLTLLVNPSVETEVLMRLDAVNTVGSSNPLQEAVSHRGPARVSAAVRSLMPGDILVVGETELSLPLEAYAYARLGERFMLRPIRTDGQGLQAFRLTARG